MQAKNTFASKEDKVNEIYKQIMGFSRIRKELKKQVLKIIETVVDRQAKFDFNYYLTKNCPLPSDWKERKKEITSDRIKNDPAAKKEAYKELFDYNSTNF